jgi:hypothetical protein
MSNPSASSSYALAGQLFRTKREIKQYVRAVINETPVGGTIDNPVIYSLLQVHPDWDKKSLEMRRLYADRLSIEQVKATHKTILIERSGDVMDISWNWCIELLKKDGTARKFDPRIDHLAKIKHAARVSIQYQIDKVEKLPGEEIDHIYPRTFNRLLYLFLRWWGASLMDIQIDSKEGVISAYLFNDWEIESEWCHWHQRLARLRAIPAEQYRAARLYHVNWSLLP